MSKSNLDMKEMFNQMASFYLNNDITEPFIREQYIRMKPVYLNLFIMGGYFDIAPEDNKALYKFCVIPIYIQDSEHNVAWYRLFEGNNTNEDVLRYFCLTNDINYDCFPQASNPELDSEWFRKWLDTPIEDFQSFGLSEKHAESLRRSLP